jgi:DNA-binding transcriptional LysR family regulator
LHADEINHLTLYGPEGQRERVRIRSNFRCNNGENLKIAACKGLGITFLPEFYIADEIRHGELLTLLPEYTFPSISAYAVYPSKRYLPEKTRALIDFLVENLNPINAPKLR